MEQRGELIAHLQGLHGVGEVSASILADEVFFRGFQNRQEVASYVGMMPPPHSSGSKDTDQGLDKAGNALARWAMIELTWRWLYYQPDSALSRWFHEQVGNARGRLRRIKLVAMARKLLVALWRYVTHGIVPEDAVTTARLAAVAAERNVAGTVVPRRSGRTRDRETDGQTAGVRRCKDGSRPSLGPTWRHAGLW